MKITVGKLDVKRDEVNIHWDGLTLELTAEETAYLEERYVPHPLAGVMAQNKPANSREEHVWSTGDQKIGAEK